MTGRAPKPKAGPRGNARKGKHGPRWKRWLGRGLLVALVLAALGAAAVTVVFLEYARDLPTASDLRRYEPPQTTRVLDRHGALLGEIFSERRTVVPLDRIPRVMILATLAAEDADFFQHRGLDYPGILRAIMRDIVERRRAQGASTITQQVVKLLLLSPERTFRRKVREMILARRIEQTLTKEEILFLYLNHINYGHGRYGVEEASGFYFGKHAAELTLAEATLLAGIPQSPSQLSPRKNAASARARQMRVIDQLERKRETHWPELSAKDIAAAREAQIKLRELPAETESAPEVVAMARRELLDRVGEGRFARGGFVVHTTIDLGLQREARAALQRRLEELDGRHGFRVPLKAKGKDKPNPAKAPTTLRVGGSYGAEVVDASDESRQVTVQIGAFRGVFGEDEYKRYNPKALKPSEAFPVGAALRVSVVALSAGGGEGGAESGAPASVRPEIGPEGAVVVIDPRTRDVRALVGGYEGSAGLNRAVQSVRQPGSSFKPIVYALAIRSRKFTPATLVLDAPAVYDKWQPTNFEAWTYSGAIRLREAVAKSVNLVAVRVIEELGPKAVVDFARELGITTDLDPSLPLALGASDVRPVELVNAYATFAAGGVWAPYRVVSKIEDADGQPVAHATEAPARRVMTEAEAYVVTSLLEGVVKVGTGTAAQALERPAAGKTGTSNSARDAWFVGYTPTTVAGVWVGFDDRRSLGKRESGGRAAVPLWVDVLRTAEAGTPVLEFPVPSGVVSASIEPMTGLLARPETKDPLGEIFLEGTAPTDLAPAADRINPRDYYIEQLEGEAPAANEAPVADEGSPAQDSTPPTTPAEATPEGAP